MLRIIGDDIELYSKVVAKIVVKPSILRDELETLVDCADYNAISETEHKETLEAAENDAYTRQWEICFDALEDKLDNDPELRDRVLAIMTSIKPE